MSACLQRSQRSPNAPIYPAWRRDRKGMGRAGRCYRGRGSVGRLGERLGPQPGQRPLGGVVRAGRPAFRLAWRHPRQGHLRPGARLCRDRASYAAVVGRCLERRPNARIDASVTWVSTFMTSSSHHPASATCCADRGSTATRSRSFGDRPFRPRRSHSAVPDCAVDTPARACPAPCFVGHEQFTDLTDCAGSSPGNPAAAALPE
jgi:hypothetical protein